MTTSAPHHRYTFRDYLDLEETSTTKHEFFAGEIYAMAGGSPEHAALSMAFGAALLTQVGPGCRVFSSDLKVRAAETGLTTYPDVTVVCGPLETDPASSAVVTNPILIVEVLSESTEEYDRGTKLEHYKTIASLRTVLLVSQSEVHVVRMERSADGSWATSEYQAGDVIEVDTIDSTLDVAALYQSAGVDSA